MADRVHQPTVQAVQAAHTGCAGPKHVLDHCWPGPPATHQSCPTAGSSSPRSRWWGCSPGPAPPAPQTAGGGGAAAAGGWCSMQGMEAGKPFGCAPSVTQSTAAPAHKRKRNAACRRDRNAAAPCRSPPAHLRRHVLQLHGDHAVVWRAQLQRVALHAFYPAHQRDALAHKLGQLLEGDAGRGVAAVERCHGCCWCE